MKFDISKTIGVVEAFKLQSEFDVNLFIYNFWVGGNMYSIYGEYSDDGALESYCFNNVKGIPSDRMLETLVLKELVKVFGIEELARKQMMEESIDGRLR